MDKWTDRLSDYIDNELSTSERDALEAHLLECADCGEMLQQLRAVVARAGQVLDRPPENDLWTGIAARMTAPAPEAAPTRTLRKVSFSIPQLAAAAITVMLLSSGTVYLMLNRDGGQRSGSEQVAMNPAPGEPAPGNPAPGNPAPGNATTPAAGDRARSVPAPATATVPVSLKAERNYSTAITELEAAMHNSNLDTATVRVLENNLRIIDKAIADARSALDKDPANPYLNHYLDATMQKKIQLLRRATGIVRART